MGHHTPGESPDRGHSTRAVDAAPGGTRAAVSGERTKRPNFFRISKAIILATRRELSYPVAHLLNILNHAADDADEVCLGNPRVALIMGLSEHSGEDTVKKLKAEALQLGWLEAVPVSASMQQRLRARRQNATGSRGPVLAYRLRVPPKWANARLSDPETMGSRATVSRLATGGAAPTVVAQTVGPAPTVVSETVGGQTEKPWAAARGNGGRAAAETVGAAPPRSKGDQTTDQRGSNFKDGAAAGAAYSSSSSRAREQTTTTTTTAPSTAEGKATRMSDPNGRTDAWSASDELLESCAQKVASGEAISGDEMANVIIRGTLEGWFTPESHEEIWGSIGSCLREMYAEKLRERKERREHKRRQNAHCGAAKAC